MQFLSPYFVVTKVQIANQQMHLASMNMQMKALRGFIYTFFVSFTLPATLNLLLIQTTLKPKSRRLLGRVFLTK